MASNPPNLGSKCRKFNNELPYHSSHQGFVYTVFCPPTRDSHGLKYKLDFSVAFLSRLKSKLDDTCIVLKIKNGTTNLFATKEMFY